MRGILAGEEDVIPSRAAKLMTGRRRLLGGLALLPAATLAGPRSGAAEAPEPVPLLVLGAAEAPVSVIEYFSFSCTHCRRFHQEVMPELRLRYIDRGLVRFTLRDFPLNLPALKAAQGARCAGPERAEALVEALWREWEAWIDLSEPEPGIVRVIGAEGLPPAQVEACLADEGLEREVLASYMYGARMDHVERTPSFVINGARHRGFIPLARFERLIEEAMG